MTFNEIEKEITKRVGAKNILLSQVKSALLKIKEKEKNKKDLTKALEIIQVVAQLTQKELEYHISEIVTLALQAVFPRPYKLILEFTLRRNRTEADIFLEDEEGNKVNPIDSTGGGVVDVASFALRIAMWSLYKSSINNTIILDEPFRFLSSDLQGKASIILKELSSKLGIQFIIITHEEKFLENADKIFKVENKQGISSVALYNKELKN